MSTASDKSQKNKQSSLQLNFTGHYYNKICQEKK